MSPTIHLAALEWLSVTQEAMSIAEVTYLPQLPFCPLGQPGQQEGSGRRVLPNPSFPPLLPYAVQIQLPQIPEASGEPSSGRFHRHLRMNTAHY